MDSKFLCTQVFIIALSLVLFETRGKAAVPSLQDYLSCANTINSIKFESGCNDVQASINCVKSLADSTDSCPADRERKGYISCSVLQNSNKAPMAGRDSRGGLSICRQLDKLNKCNKDYCGEDGQFKLDIYNRRVKIMGEPEVACSIRGQNECVAPIVSNDELTAESCGNFSIAMDCYIDKLMDCSGSDENQMAADLILIGLHEQEKQCKKQGLKANLPFCESNPLEGAKEKFDLVTGVSKHNCKVYHELGDTLQRFVTECSDKAPDYRFSEVKKALSGANGARVTCYKKFGCDASNSEMLSTDPDNGSYDLKVTSATITAIFGTFIYHIIHLL